MKSELKNHLLRGSIEFVVIVVGVLAALAADEWRQARADRVAEATYVARLVADLQEDSVSLRRAEAAWRNKVPTLERLIALSIDTGVGQDAAEDIAAASAWTWDLVRPHSTTYEEMRSSGRLGLIQDASVRAAVGQYYWWYDDMLGSVNARRTDFGPISYRLVRRVDPQQGGATFSARASVLSPQDLTMIVSSPDFALLRGAAIAELNFSYVNSSRIDRQAELTEDLLSRLRSYLEA